MAFASGTATADTLNWDAVAQCESGGDWSTNTGNGHYGGLQFKQATWSSHGGQGNPATASRSQQIQVAERVLANEGLQAWPKCGSRGLAAGSTVWTDLAAPAPAAQPASGCAAVRSGSILGVVNVRQLCSALLNPLAALGQSR